MSGFDQAWSSYVARRNSVDEFSRHAYPYLYAKYLADENESHFFDRNCTCFVDDSVDFDDTVNRLGQLIETSGRDIPETMRMMADAYLEDHAIASTLIQRETAYACSKMCDDRLTLNSKGFVMDIQHALELIKEDTRLPEKYRWTIDLTDGTEIPVFCAGDLAGLDSSKMNDESREHVRYFLADLYAHQNGFDD